MTRTKLYLTYFAFAVPAVLLWVACLADYENSGGDRSNIGFSILAIVALTVAYYMPYKAAIAVLRKKHPTWNGKIPKWGAKFENKTEDEETSKKHSVKQHEF